MIVLFFKFDWADSTETGVPASRIVEAKNEVDDAPASLLSGPIEAICYFLGFQRV